MGEGSITDVATGKVTKFYGAATPLSPQQELMNTEVERLKKFYGEQYKVEMGKFAGQPMTDEEFKDIAGKLQSKYKLAFNEARFQMESRSQPKEQTALKQFSDMDIYRGKLEDLLGGKGYFREIPVKKRGILAKIGLVASPATMAASLAFGKRPTGETTLEIFDPQTGDYRPAKSEEENIHNEIRRVREIQNALIGQPTSPLMTTAATSKRMGGSIAEQTKNYLQQKETGVQRQEPEQIIERGGKRWRIVGHDTDGTPLVEEVR